MATTNIENNIEVPEINLTNDNNNSTTEDPALELDIPSSGPDETDAESSNRETSDEISCVNVLTEINIEAKNNRNTDKIDTTPISSTPTSSISLTDNPSIEAELEPKPGGSAESVSNSSTAEKIPNPLDTVLKKRKNCAKLKTGLINNNKFVVKVPISSVPKIKSADVNTSVDGVGVKVKKVTLRVSSISNHGAYTPNSLSSRDSCSDSSGRCSNGTFDSARSEKKKKESLHSLNSNTGNCSYKLNRKQSKNDVDLLGTPSSTRNPKRSSIKAPHSAVPANINISSDFCKDPNQKNGGEQSNMFLYIDLHGHASKKGVFMYGNYLPNIAESVECMLLPRLMSLNSHHFHFDACVFSERNMYHKYVNHENSKLRL